MPWTTAGGRQLDSATINASRPQCRFEPHQHEGAVLVLEQMRLKCNDEHGHQPATLASDRQGIHTEPSDGGRSRRLDGDDGLVSHGASPSYDLVQPMARNTLRRLVAANALDRVRDPPERLTATPRAR